MLYNNAGSETRVSEKYISFQFIGIFADENFSGTETRVPKKEGNFYDNK